MNPHPARAATTWDWNNTTLMWELSSSWNLTGYPNTHGVPNTGDIANLTGATATKTGGVIDVAILNLLNASTLRFSTNSLLALSGGTQTVNFGNVDTNSLASSLSLDGSVTGGTVLTIAAGTTLIGRIGSIGSSYTGSNNCSTTNSGTITSNVSGNGTTIYNLTNNGTVQANNGASLYLTTAGSTTATINGASGAVFQTGGGTLSIGNFTNNGMFMVNGSTLTVNGTLRGPGIYNLTNSALGQSDFALDGSTLNVSGGTTLSGARTLYLQNGATLTADTFNLNDNSRLFLSGNNNTLTGNFVFGNTDSNLQASYLELDGNITGGTTFTIAAGTSFSGRIYSFGDYYNSPTQQRTIVNNGTITSNVSGNLTTINPTNFTNNATVQAINGASLYFRTTNTPVNSAGAAVSLTGGGTLFVGNFINNGTFAVSGSTLTANGILSGSKPYNLTNSALGQSDFALDGSTLNVSGGTTLSGARTLYLQNGATLTADTFNLNDNSRLFLSGNNNTLTGNFVFGNTDSNLQASYLELDGNITGGTTFTIAAGTSFSGRIYSFGDYYNSPTQQRTIVNNGIINSNVMGNTTTVNPTNFTNNGTTEATNGGLLTINTTNTATNTGTLLAGTGSAVTLSQSVTQTAGTTDVEGTLNVSSGRTLTLQGGTLIGKGTISASGAAVSNVGGNVNAGGVGTAGTLTMSSGTYTQGALGVFSSEVGGTTQGSQYDFFSINGAANLGGRLSVSLINSFSPTIGQEFQILGYTSHTGTFTNADFYGNPNTVLAPSTAGNYLFGISYRANGVFITAQGEATPEPSTVALTLMGGLFPVSAALARRRRRKE